MTIEVDAWTDCSGRSVLGIVANFPDASGGNKSYFMRSIDISERSHTSEYIGSLVSEEIERI